MDHFQVLKACTIQSLFEDEFLWLKQNRWNLADHNQSNMLLLFDTDSMSLHHLNQVRQWMQAEVAAKVKSEQEAQRKASNPAALSGGYIRQ
jgi:uncharacterized protein with von Willebrand factor type A (vWA) domain